jgi:hypothetical protein
MIQPRAPAAAIEPRTGGDAQAARLRGHPSPRRRARPDPHGEGAARTLNTHPHHVATMPGTAFFARSAKLSQDGLHRVDASE